MSKRVTISLTGEQRSQLTQLICSGTAAARTLTRARVLLLADHSQSEKRSNKSVAQATGLHHVTVGHLLHRFIVEGLEATLYESHALVRSPKSPVTSKRIW